MEVTLNSLHEDMVKMKRQLDAIRNIISEGELTDWAKEELANARSEVEDSYTSLNNL